MTSQPYLGEIQVALPAKGVLQGQGGLGRLLPLQHPMDEGGLQL